MVSPGGLRSPTPVVTHVALAGLCGPFAAWP